MIVNEGKLVLLEAQGDTWRASRWALFTDDTVISATTELADLGPEAAWSGYARSQVSAVSGPTIVAGKAVYVNTVLPAFLNTSGAPVTFYVLALLNPDQDGLIDARNLGLTSIADGSSYIFAGSFTDDQA